MSRRSRKNKLPKRLKDIFSISRKRVILKLPPLLDITNLKLVS
jgi:hypothetical protein